MARTDHCPNRTRQENGCISCTWSVSCILGCTVLHPQANCDQVHQWVIDSCVHGNTAGWQPNVFHCDKVWRLTHFLICFVLQRGPLAKQRWHPLNPHAIWQNIEMDCTQAGRTVAPCQPETMTAWCYTYLTLCVQEASANLSAGSACTLGAGVRCWLIDNLTKLSGYRARKMQVINGLCLLMKHAQNWFVCIVLMSFCGV